jgi:hypothetical protein
MEGLEVLKRVKKHPKNEKMRSNREKKAKL